MKWIVVDVHAPVKDLAKVLQDKLNEISDDDFVVFGIKYIKDEFTMRAHIILHERGANNDNDIPFSPTPIFDRVDESGQPLTRDEQLTN